MGLCGAAAAKTHRRAEARRRVRAPAAQAPGAL